jgi:hypothetical protein
MRGVSDPLHDCGPTPHGAATATQGLRHGLTLRRQAAPPSHPCGAPAASLCPLQRNRHRPALLGHQAPRERPLAPFQRRAHAAVRRDPGPLCVWPAPQGAEPSTSLMRAAHFALKLLEPATARAPSPSRQTRTRNAWSRNKTAAPRAHPAALAAASSEALLRLYLASLI